MFGNFMRFEKKIKPFFFLLVLTILPVLFSLAVLFIDSESFNVLETFFFFCNVWHGCVDGCGFVTKPSS